MHEQFISKFELFMNINISCHNTVCHALFNSITVHQFYTVNMHPIRNVFISVILSTHKNLSASRKQIKMISLMNSMHGKDFTLTFSTQKTSFVLYSFPRSFNLFVP